MSDVPRPIETGSTEIELSSEGLANSILSRLIQWGYEVEYDEESEKYRVGEYYEGNDPVREEIRHG